jgi:[acyl-carrier-protein] S-malonyltransferase
MEPVKPRLADVLSKISFSAPQVPVVTNVEAKPNADAARIQALLVEQVTAPVRWIECVLELERQGVTKVVELGPGKVLGGLVRRITKGIETYNVEAPEQLEKVLAAVGG